MRRRAPRTMGPALAQVVDGLAPATTLARVQRVWAEAAGPAVAAAAEPAAERDGVLTIACESSVWAQEIELLANDLLERLNGAIAEPGGTSPLRSLRVRTGR